jgi:hypothetical protein
VCILFVYFTTPFQLASSYRTLTIVITTRGVDKSFSPARIETSYSDQIRDLFSILNVVEISRVA